jgi:hypothetical protein
MSVGEEKDVFGVVVSRCASEAGGRRTVHDRGRQLGWVLVVLWMLAPGAVQAQESSRQPTAEEASATEAPPQASQVGAMLGGAEYMLILDRPFAAEKLFNGVLAMDPKNAHARDGLRRAKLAKRTSWIFLAHTFGNHYGTELEAYGGGPSIYTPQGKFTFWVGDGFFRSGGATLRKVTLNWFWDTYYKNFDGYAYINRTFYPDAPDRTLYDFKGTWNRRPGREYYSVFGGQHDSFLQNDVTQFFAPESLGMVVQKILIHNIGAEAQIPLGKPIDFIPYYSEYYYTDNNQRHIAQGKLMYRVLPRGEAKMPIFRIGAMYLSDSCKFGSGIYNCPVNFHSVSVNSDFVIVTGKYRFGVFAQYPITGTSGDGQFPFNGRFDPAETLYSFVNYKVRESQEVWLKFLGAHSAGFSPSAFDVVVGTTVRF